MLGKVKHDGRYKKPLDDGSEFQKTPPKKNKKPLVVGMCMDVKAVTQCQR